MNIKPNSLLALLKAITIVLLLLLTTCKTEREWDNPYDPKTNLDPSAWAPTNLQISSITLGSLTLTWEYSKTQFDGFKVDRKVNSDSWEVAFATLEPSVKTFTDTQIDLAASVYNYKVYAFAGENSSSALEKQIQPTLVSTVEVNSISHYTAKSGGSVTTDALLPITARGVVWSTTQNPTIPTKEGKQTDILKDTLLTKSDTLQRKSNKELPKIKLSIPDITSKVSSTPITTLTQNGGYTTDGSGTGSWTSDISGLQPSTTYYVRAYSKTSAGTAYGSEKSFTTFAPTIPTITTNSITSITATTATTGGNITSDGGAAVTARGVVWSTSQTPTITSNIGITSNGTGTGIFTSHLTNLQPGTVYYVRTYATNNVGTQYGNQVSFSSTMPDGPGGTITDADGNTYNTIWINGRHWMKENLKTTKYRDGSSIPNVTDNGAWATPSTPAYCWNNNDIANKPTYGALYNYYAVSTGNLCPTGWHVPTDTEWKTLEIYLGMTQAQADASEWRGTDQGTQLKSTSGWNSGGNGTDNFGFSALPGGYRGGYLGTFDGMGGYGLWWSSTELDAAGAWGRGITYDFGNVGRINYIKISGLSVRCIRD